MRRFRFAPKISNTLPSIKAPVYLERKARAAGYPYRNNQGEIYRRFKVPALVIALGAASEAVE